MWKSSSLFVSANCSDSLTPCLPDSDRVLSHNTRIYIKERAAITADVPMVNLEPIQVDTLHLLLWLLAGTRLLSAPEQFYEFKTFLWCHILCKFCSYNSPKVPKLSAYWVLWLTPWPNTTLILDGFPAATEHLSWTAFQTGLSQMFCLKSQLITGLVGKSKVSVTIRTEY